MVISPWPLHPQGGQISLPVAGPRTQLAEIAVESIAEKLARASARSPTARPWQNHTIFIAGPGDGEAQGMSPAQRKATRTLESFLQEFGNQVAPSKRLRV